MDTSKLRNRNEGIFASVYSPGRGEEHSQKEERYIRKEYSRKAGRGTFALGMKGIFARNIHQSRGGTFALGRKGIFARNIHADSKGEHSQ